MQIDQALEIVSEIGPVIGHAARECVPLQIVRVRQVIDVRQKRAEGGAVIGQAAHGNTGEAHAVIAAFAADQHAARAFALEALIGERDLERRLDGLGARIAEEHVRERLGHVGDDA